MTDLDAMLADLAAVEQQAARLRSAIIAALVHYLVPAPASPPDLAGEAPTSGPVPSTQPPHGGRDGGAPGPGRRTVYDYSRVAAVARQAHADGESMIAAVATVWGVGHDMGRWLISEARRRGHDIPRADRSAAARRANAARWANPEARVSTPKPPPVDPAHAAAVAEARTRVGEAWTPQPGAACHVCDDCGAPYERVSALSAHVHAEHHRPPTASERRFSIWEGE